MPGQAQGSGVGEGVGLVATGVGAGVVEIAFFVSFTVAASFLGSRPSIALATRVTVEPSLLSRFDDVPEVVFSLGSSGACIARSAARIASARMP
jgi:hypothetical protein